MTTTTTLTADMMVTALRDAGAADNTAQELYAATLVLAGLVRVAETLPKMGTIVRDWFGYDLPKDVAVTKESLAAVAPRLRYASLMKARTEANKAYSTRLDLLQQAYNSANDRSLDGLRNRVAAVMFGPGSISDQINTKSETAPKPPGEAIAKAILAGKLDGSGIAAILAAIDARAAAVGDTEMRNKEIISTLPEREKARLEYAQASVTEHTKRTEAEIDRLNARLDWFERERARIEKESAEQETRLREAANESDRRRVMAEDITTKALEDTAKAQGDAAAAIAAAQKLQRKAS